MQEVTGSDLGFRGSDTSYASHNTHAFAAKFPPQLPRLFIDALTAPGEVVLDPMAGSGTALVEAALAGRTGLGVEIDPLAALIAQAKVLPFRTEDALAVASAIDAEARDEVQRLEQGGWPDYMGTRSQATREFIAYWFEPRTAVELAALAAAVRKHATGALAPFFQTVFSSLIVTKSGGVSRARDLAHTRPHLGPDKAYRDATRLFQQRASRSIASIAAVRDAPGAARVLAGDARHLPLASDSVDLIVTSPPYANAIDYMRAHKFSLVWLGQEIRDLGMHRRRYIGSEVRALRQAQDGGQEPAIPLSGPLAQKVMHSLHAVDASRARVIGRYFEEMTLVLAEMRRVLRPDRAAVVVVGSSTVRGIVVPTPFVLAEIAEAVGFNLVAIRERPIDRNRRLMPVSSASAGRGIEARMHSEHVISLLKR